MASEAGRDSISIPINYEAKVTFRKYLKDSVIVQLLRNAGFSDDRLVRLGDGPAVPTTALGFALIQGESAGDPLSLNVNNSPKPAQGWFPGGKTTDVGIIQWNDYYWLSDPASFMWEGRAYPTRDEAMRLALNPVWSVQQLAKYTNNGVKNWSTWNAFTNGSYQEFIPRALKALELPTPPPFWKVTVGGRTSIKARSVPTRCNPAIRWDRWVNVNESYRKTPDALIKPGTELYVTNTTTKLQAGPVYVVPQPE